MIGWPAWKWGWNSGSDDLAVVLERVGRLLAVHEAVLAGRIRGLPEPGGFTLTRRAAPTPGWPLAAQPAAE